jgi:hypothetical protein
LSNAREIILTLREVARIHQLSHREDDELVEQRDYVAPRLVDCEDDCAVVVSSKRHKALDDVVGVVCIET